MNTQYFSKIETPPGFPQWAYKTEKPKCSNCIKSELLHYITKEDKICYYCYLLGIKVDPDFYCPKHEFSKL